MLERLPHWHLANKCPAFLETESLTAIEMVSRLYGKTNELVDDYNKFVDNINAHIDAFENDTTKNYDLFSVAIRQEFQDFIDVVELKVTAQNNEITNAIKYMRENLKMSTDELLHDIIIEYETTMSDTANTVRTHIAESETKYNNFTSATNLRVGAVEEQIAQNNATVENAVVYMQTNIRDVATEVVNNALEAGSWTIATKYDEATESLTISTAKE